MVELGIDINHNFDSVGQQQFTNITLSKKEVVTQQVNWLRGNT